jgi:endonuclease/exonuclease/phosphatase family metal-dependent hydrolase
MNLLIFAHHTIKDNISCIHSNIVKTGIANVMGNKGGIGICFTFKEKSFLFINSHLAAGHNSTEERNKDFNRINTCLNLDDIIATEKKKITDQFDSSIWMGDLNYRLKLEPEDALEYILNDDLHVLSEYDQLNDEIIKNKLEINSFLEGPLVFNPTYKYFTGQTEADKYEISKRIPGWTDRILYKSKENNLSLCKYHSLDGTFTSDHKPVYAVFEYNFRTTSKRRETKINREQSKLCLIF